MQIGDKVRVIPDFVLNHGIDEGRQDVRSMVGTVIHINRAHRHYTLEFDVHGHKIRETFKAMPGKI